MATIIFVGTMDRWIKAFAGLILAATLRAAAAIVLGYLPENAEKVIPRLTAIAVTMLLSASVYFVIRMAQRKLKSSDRIAVFAFTCSLFWAMADEPKTLLGITVGFAFLLSAWAWDRRHERAIPPRV